MLKAAEKRRLSSLVHDALKAKPEVRPFPAAVAQLLAACQDPNANAARFEKIITLDPALAVRLLRMANSPLYGLASEVRSVSHAVAILGIRQLRSLAMSVAGAGMFAQGKTASIERAELWSHSLGCATVARLLAATVPGVSAEDSFLGGIFHDVGKLFLLDVVPAEYNDMSMHCFGDDLAREEQFVFDITHEEIGLRSAHAWRLNESLKVAIGYHHRPTETPLNPELVRVIHAADLLARQWGIGSSQHDFPDYDATLADFNLSIAAADDWKQRSQEIFSDTLLAISG